jgi:F0F1-type ATP synthase delta subunit
MIDDYTRLLEATAEIGDKAASDAAVSKLILHLKSSGRIQMLPQLVRELKKVAARRHAMRPHVEVAHEKESAHALHAAAALGIISKHTTVNPSLIHGWRATSGDKLVDRSAKQALLHIYQKVTA